LVHSAFKKFDKGSDIVLKIELEGRYHDIHVLVRPGVNEFLEKMSKHYELIVFTASLSKYAEPLVDHLDPKRVCYFRLFREHCTMINGAFVKDLKRLDRDMKDIIILDVLLFFFIF
jgi:RNA polymerase II subunit A small phosphatase-like protein